MFDPALALISTVADSNTPVVIINPPDKKFPVKATTGKIIVRAVLVSSM